MNLKSVFIVILLIALFGVATYFSIEIDRDDETNPEQTFLLNKVELVSGNGLLICQIHLIANGSRSIEFTEAEGHSNIAVDADQQTGMMEASLLIVADLVSFPDDDKSYFTLLAQLQGEGVTAGGPSRYTLPQDVSLSDILVIDIVNGSYPIGDQIQIGSLQGEPIYLMVQ